MAAFHPFNASNKAGTCLWCGRKLRRHKKYVRVTEGSTSKWVPSGETEEGDYGDGFFCGLRCAYKYAVEIARLGNRLERE